MAKLPDWVETKYIGIENDKVVFEIKIKYIPLRFLLGVIRKSIGWRIWQYPKVVRACLDRIGVTLDNF